MAIGTVLAFAFSARRGLISQEDASRVAAHFAAVDLPTRISDIPGPPIAAETLMQHIAQDKKVSRGQLTFILLNGIGSAFVAHDVPPGEVAEFLAEQLAT